MGAADGRNGWYLRVRNIGENDDDFVMRTFCYYDTQVRAS